MKIVISSPALLVLFLIFLKAVGAITWSWWWVLFPIWLPAALLIALLIFTALAVVISSFNE